ncbi:MAG: dockerin type I repeat-containing protein [Ruminococcus sp.]|nr:dockerin type I repeat-containing protein [Ruminococcus sp.]
MKKMKNIIALITGGVMLLSTGMNVSAIYGHEGPEPPEGMEYFDDYGLFEGTYCGVTGRDIPEYGRYKTLWANEEHTRVRIWSPIQQNFTLIRFNQDMEPSVWQEIYEKYSAELDFDHVQIYEDALFCWDHLDEDGNETADISDVTDKSDLIIEMSREMQEAGLLKNDPDASHANPYYVRYYANQTPRSIIDTPLKIKAVSATAEELQAVVSAYDAELTVAAVEGENYLYKVDTNTTDQMVAVAGVIKTAFPDADMAAFLNDGVPDSGDEAVSIGEIDILAELEKPATTYGDLNQDGKVTVLDAITLSKANIQAITLNESQTAAADCNGDGLIDSADVTVLLYYLTDKVDVLPVTIE